MRGRAFSEGGGGRGDIPDLSEKGVETSSKSPDSHFVSFSGLSISDHDGSGCVVEYLVYYNECIMRLGIPGEVKLVTMSDPAGLCQF